MRFSGALDRSIRYAKAKLGFFIVLWSHYRRFAEFLSWPKLFALQALGLSAAFLNMVGFASIFPAIGVLLSDEKTFLVKHVYRYVPESSVPTFAKEHLFVALLGCMLAIQLLKFATAVAYAGLGGKWTQFHTGRVRDLILDAYQDLAIKRGEKDEKSKLLHLNAQLPQLNSYSWALVDTNLKIYNFVFILSLLLFLSAKLLVLSLVVTGLVLLALIPFFQWTRSCANRLFFVQHQLIKRVRTFMEGLETIRTLNSLPTVRSGIEDQNLKLISHDFRLSLSRQIIFSLPEFLIFITLAFVLLLIPKNASNLALFGAFGYTLVRLINALNDMSGRFNALLEAKQVPDEIYSYINHIQRPIKKAGVGSSLGRITQILFRNVSVSFDGSQIVKDIQLEVPIGELTQVIGENGSGKSTLFRCLLKLVPYSGSITINGVNLNEIPEEILYEKIAYHSQQNFLIPGTILENLLFGNSSAKRKEVVELCNELGMDFTSRFPEGLDHDLSEDGENLSGGERQFICLVRTLLRPAEIYILDEFTNHLSAEIAQKISVYLQKILGVHTILLISHQQVSLSANRIRMKGGRIQKEILNFEERGEAQWLA